MATIPAMVPLTGSGLMSSTTDALAVYCLPDIKVTVAVAATTSMNVMNTTSQ